ncbi:hypothetical protein SCLARK_00502 [Spiroplasma clarkii]|uniref:hypothetical protein n=1 Tax=Spiroplasma clarkii TaxID=2139 RepID=UPI000B57EC68|nr:hypothetical protein [Spiroplasma clarkii]ARU91196.1 hypothetical protein SCLARK_00502 [Spiroplasma clarkii]
MKKLLYALSSFFIFVSPTLAVACGGLSFNHPGVDKETELPDEDDEDEIPAPEISAEYQHFVDYNKYLNDFNLGADFKAYEKYQNHNKISRGFQLSNYIPTSTFLHKNDEVKVYLNKSKTTSADLDFIKNNKGVFMLECMEDELHHLTIF